MSEVSRAEIHNEILRLVRTEGPVGWYVIEQLFTIPRASFPGQTNVMTFINELLADGRLLEVDIDGERAYELAARLHS